MLFCTTDSASNIKISAELLSRNTYIAVERYILKCLSYGTR